jgi:hypothetical protein
VDNMRAGELTEAGVEAPIGGGRLFQCEKPAPYAFALQVSTTVCEGATEEREAQ